MKDFKNTEQLAEQAIGSLDNLQQVEANEFLAAKAWQRMQSRKPGAAPLYNKVLLRLAIVLLIFTGVNCLSFYVLGTQNKPEQEIDGVSAFADAYGLSGKSENY